MGQRKARPTEPSQVIKTSVLGIRSRRDLLVRELACAYEWRRLQFDAIAALIEAQRTFLELHSKIVALLGHDQPLYAQLRVESLEVTQASDQLRALIRDIERVLVEH